MTRAGHAPTLGQTRKRRQRPLGKMAPSGLKAVVGESECHPGPGSCVSWGARGQGHKDSGTPAAGSAAGRQAPVPRRGGRGLGSSWTSWISLSEEERSWETGLRGSGQGWRRQVPRPRFLGPPTVPAGGGHSWTPRLCSPSQAKPRGLDSWGPMLRTRAGLGAPISDARWSECSGGVSRPVFGFRSGGRLSFCFPMRVRRAQASRPRGPSFLGKGGDRPLPHLG